MQRLIDYAVEMMIEENYNAIDNPTQNPELHNSQNIDINASQNWELAPSQNPEWRQEWWNKFKELPIWEHMNNSQKQRCLNFLKRM